MANKTITDLTELTTPANDDVIAIDDTNASVTKKITYANISSNLSITASQVTDFSSTVSANTDVVLNTTHRSSSGIDHTYIDQDVTTTASPTFDEPTLDAIQFNLTPSVSHAEGLLHCSPPPTQQH